MPGNFLRQTPNEARLERDVEIMRDFVVRLNAFVDDIRPEEANIADLFANDFIDTGRNYLEVEVYINEIHELAGTGV